MAALESHVDVITDLINEGKSHAQISEYLQALTGENRGFSERNVRRICREHGLKRWSLVPDEDFNLALQDAVEETGPSYGRKMMTGHLAAHGLKVSEVRVGKALREAHQPYHQMRQQGARNLNPIPYHAEYFGHKLHMDQNEKIGMFGSTHILAIDGYSSNIVGWTTIPVKNNLLIYEKVYRPAVATHGMWDQLRADHGTEFYLCLYVQERNQEFRTNLNRQPYIQTESRRNHKIERMWPEVNQRVNYPIKAALVELVDSDQLDMDDELVKFCTSNLCIKLAEVGIEQVVNAWNAHRIPGRGIPNQLRCDSRAAPITADHLPSSEEAAELYKIDVGTSLTKQAVFGRDPFQTEEARQNCEAHFFRDTPDLKCVYSQAVNGQFQPLQEAILHLVDLTSRLS